MRGPMHFEPLISVDLVGTENRANGIVKDLRSRAG